MLSDQLTKMRIYHLKTQNHNGFSPYSLYPWHFASQVLKPKPYKASHQSVPSASLHPSSPASNSQHYFPLTRVCLCHGSNKWFTVIYLNAEYTNISITCIQKDKEAYPWYFIFLLIHTRGYFLQ